MVILSKGVECKPKQMLQNLYVNAYGENSLGAKYWPKADALKAFGLRSAGLRDLAAKVRSGDPANIEGMAARRYWPLMMGKEFRRDRKSGGANAMLNYGYMILRAATARSILAAGLHPSLSVHPRKSG